jgi:DNA-binding FadR family transcriptional regulator
VIIRSNHAVEQLEQLLLLRILSGEFANSDVLPSQRALAEQYGVCRNTVGSAVGRLIARGLCTSRTGLGIHPVQLIQALDHKLLLELVKQAENLARSMRLLEQLLAVVRGLLTDAAAEAANCREATHVGALRELLLVVSSRGESGEDGEPVATPGDEFNLWRIVAGGAGSLATTAALNGLRGLWLDASILRGSTTVPLAMVEELATAIERHDKEGARVAAGKVLEARERFVRSAAGRSGSELPTGPPAAS